MAGVAKDDISVVGFKADRNTRRLARALAAKLDFEDVASLMRFLLNRELDRNFSEEDKRRFLESVILEERPKARTVRRG